ncbi:MAG: DUF5320 domain-containing protein [Desulfobacterales bacterium]|nr:DUF5320 domain-containing protein [Desulfobacterales bacterium]
MTGRRAGFCAGFAMPGYENPLPGRGMGMGFGRGRGAWGRGAGQGRGWRNMFFAAGQPGWMRYGSAAPTGDLDPQEEKQMLKNQADAMQNELDSIRKRLEEMEKEQPSK